MISKQQMPAKKKKKIHNVVCGGAAIFPVFLFGFDMFLFLNTGSSPSNDILNGMLGQDCVLLSLLLSLNPVWYKQGLTLYSLSTTEGHFLWQLSLPCRAFLQYNVFDKGGPQVICPRPR